MEIYLHFNETSKVERRFSSVSSNCHTLPCQSMTYRDEKVIISLSPSDLLDPSTILVVGKMDVKQFGDSIQKYVEIPCRELHSAQVRTGMR